MTVWVVEMIDEGDDRSQIEGVYSTEERASGVVSALLPLFSTLTFTVSEWELDD